MKTLRQIIPTFAVVIVLAFGVAAQSDENDDQKKPRPPKDAKVVKPAEKPPRDKPPKEGTPKPGSAFY